VKNSKISLCILFSLLLLYMSGCKAQSIVKYIHVVLL
jgi:hypothetical protein